MTDPVTGNWPTGRRIKAAMRLAGIDSFEELADKIDMRNYGSRTLRKYADDQDTEYIPRRPQLMVIAEACELPYEFFTVDFAQLPAAAGGGVSARVEQLEAQQAEDAARLAQIEEAVQRLAATGPQERVAGDSQ